MKEKFDFFKYQGALRHLAFDPAKSLGRRREDDEEIGFYGDIFDPFRLDMEKIRSSKAFRRLANKTQVFPPATHPNIRNRLIHTNDVFSIAVMISDILGLNSNLTGAIALGHDIGHTAYGHLGEKTITKISGKEFSHAVMGVVVAQFIERFGRGINLSYEVLEGILYHTRGSGEVYISKNVSQECSANVWADKFGYVPSDTNDGLRIAYIKRQNIPKEFLPLIGETQREFVARVIFALVKESAEEGFISFEKSEVAQSFSALRAWMYKNIYHKLDSEADREQTSFEFREMGEFFHNSSSLKPFGRYLPMALMTDVEADAFKMNNRHCKTFSLTEQRIKFGFAEIIDRLPKDKKIDIFNPTLRKEDFKFYRRIEA
jgi:dGTPase